MACIAVTVAATGSLATSRPLLEHYRPRPPVPGRKQTGWPSIASVPESGGDPRLLRCFLAPVLDNYHATTILPRMKLRHQTGDPYLWTTAREPVVTTLDEFTSRGNKVLPTRCPIYVLCRAFESVDTIPALCPLGPAWRLRTVTCSTSFALSSSDPIFQPEGSATGDEGTPCQALRPISGLTA